MTPSAPHDPSDPHNLQRFLDVQETAYARALYEIRDGRKHTHWIWFIFPQFAGLGSSSTSRLYAIKSLAEAEAYLAHPVLGPRLVECAEAALGVPDVTARDLMGSPDDLKLRSSATLFAHVSPPGSAFERLLERFFAGEPDAATLRLIAGDRP